MPVEIFHLKVAYQPGWGVLMDSVRQTVDAARARGVDVAADMYVYTAGGTGLEATIPSWAFEGGDDSLKARLANPADPRAAQARDRRRDRRAGGTSSRRPAGGTASCSSTRAIRTNAKYEQKTHRADREGDGQGSGRRGVGSRGAGAAAA